MMGCGRFTLPGGGQGWMCGPAVDDIPVCTRCGCMAETLCDFPAGDGKTCDAAMCRDHAHQVGDDLHYCVAHMDMWQNWRQSGAIQQILEEQTRKRETLYKRGLTLIEEPPHG